MKKVLILVFILFASAYSQQKDSLINFQSPPNIKKFADFLFCEKDYLRAAIEYEKYLSVIPTDSVRFKIGLSFLYMNKFDKAANHFMKVEKSSNLFKDAEIFYYRSIFEEKEFYLFRKKYSESSLSGISILNISKLFYLTYLFTSDSLPEKDNFLMPFSNEEKQSIKCFYEWKENPPLKSSVKAALFSVIFPGAGKFYTKNYSDGIIAAIATGLFAYLAYDNFNASHNFRGWLFSGVSAFFYAGSIYGSAASAQIYNAKISFDFQTDVINFLSDKNYYTPQNNFCE